MRFTNKTILITGAARGLAEATARLIASEGANVIAGDINLPRLKDVVASINQAGAGQATALEVNVTSRTMLQDMVAVALHQHGRVDAIINIGAGYAPYKGLVNTSEEEWVSIIDSNLKSVFLACQAVLPVMLEQKYGRIVNISSLAARTYSHFLGAHYAAAKAGVLGLTRHIAHEYGPQGICANAVCPTAFHGERLAEIMTPEKEQSLIQAIPLRRIPTAQDIAPAIAFLASDEAIFVSGVSLDVNGAQVTV